MPEDTSYSRLILDLNAGRVKEAANFIDEEELATALSNHTHEGLDQLPDIITLLEHGITGERTIGGYKFTFNHGVLVGFEEV